MSNITTFNAGSAVPSFVQAAAQAGKKGILADVKFGGDYQKGLIYHILTFGRK